LRSTSDLFDFNERGLQALVQGSLEAYRSKMEALPWSKKGAHLPLSGDFSSPGSGIRSLQVA
jgi:hypothetical protein